MNDTIPERVAAGAAFLDEHEPGWDSRIDLERLDLGSSCACVLGQLYKGFGAGLIATGLLDYEYSRGADLGFHWLVGTTEAAELREIKDLTAEWHHLITERRSAS